MLTTESWLSFYHANQASSSSEVAWASRVEARWKRLRCPDRCYSRKCHPRLVHCPIVTNSQPVSFSVGVKSPWLCFFFHAEKPQAVLGPFTFLALWGFGPCYRFGAQNKELPQVHQNMELMLFALMIGCKKSKRYLLDVCVHIFFTKERCCCLVRPHTWYSISKMIQATNKLLLRMAFFISFQGSLDGGQDMW